MRVKATLMGLAAGGVILGRLGSAPGFEDPASSALPEEPAAQHSPLVVTATRESRPSFDVPPALTIVDRPEIDRRAPRVLPDLLRGEEGVFVQETTPGQGAPIVRGLIGSAILTLVDGMRLNNAIFRSAPNQYFALVDPYHVERIEVLRETGSTLYGSDAMGGVINVITPIPRVAADQWQLRAGILEQFSSADTGWVSRLSAETGRSGVAISGGFTYQDYESLRAGAPTAVQRPSGYTVFAGDTTLFLERGDQDLLLSAQYLQQPKTPRYDELVPGFGQTEPSSAVFCFEPNDRLFLHARYRLRNPVPFVNRLEINVAYQEINDDRRSRDFGSPAEDRERTRDSLTGVTLQLTSTWGPWMTFTYGGEVYLDQVASSRVRRNIATGAISTRSSRFADGSTLNSFAIYVQDAIRPHPRVGVVVGGRFSYFDTTIPKADREVGTHQETTDLTGSLGLLYRLTPMVHLVSNLGRGFRVPNVFDLSTLGPRPGNGFNIPNPSLGPEQVVTVDAGVKVLSRRFTGEVFGYYSDYRDKIEDVPTGQRTPDGRIIVQSQNLNSVTLVGVEAGGQLRLLETLELYGSLTFTWGEEEFAGGTRSPADRIPPLNGQVGLLYHPIPRLSVEPFVRFAATQDRLSDRDKTDPRINPSGTPGWVTANIRALWDISTTFRARLEVSNLVDKDYRGHGSGINAPGINATAALEARF